MRLVSRISGASLLLAAVSANATATTAEARARSFWAALKADKAAAQSMVAPDAEIGAGDVGGPFDIAALTEVRKNCEFGAKAATKLMEMRGRSINVVSVELDCTVDGSSHLVVADFMIENDRIAGMYLPGGPRPDAPGEGEK